MPLTPATGVLSSVTGRVYLYSNIFLSMGIWSVQQTLGRVWGTGHHPLNWSREQDFNIMLLKTLFTCGTYEHWRNFMSIWAMLNGKKEQQGLVLEAIPPSTFGVPGCRSSFWITLEPAELKGAPPAKASCVLLYLHGGAFMAGDPRMYCPAFKLWMKRMAAQGISMRVLSVGYPLSPENSFPAPVQAAAAAYRWLLKQLKAEGRDDTILIAGDSAGGNLVVSCLAYLRDGTLDGSTAAASAEPAVPPPAGALLISPAVDFTSSSVFGPHLAGHFAAVHSAQQQQAQEGGGAKKPGSGGGVSMSAVPAVPQPPNAKWDYITVGEGSAVAKHYVKAQTESDMYNPLVSPTLLPSFKGLVQQKMMVVWGEVEVLAPDCARFAERVKADGVHCEVHEEPKEPHVYCVLPFKEVQERGADVIIPFFCSCVKKA